MARLHMLLAGNTARPQAQLLQRALEQGLRRHLASICQRLLSGLHMHAQPQSRDMQEGR